jgi:hypothetical protein
MTSTNRLIRTIEEQLKDMNLEPEEEAKQRKIMYKAFRIEIEGFTSQDIELPEGAILIGVHKGELKQALATKGQLWVDGEPFTSISGAAFKATDTRTLTGWELWKMVYIPRTGFIEVKDLRVTATRAYVRKEK